MISKKKLSFLLTTKEKNCYLNSSFSCTCIAMQLILYRKHFIFLRWKSSAGWKIKLSLACVCAVNNFIYFVHILLYNTVIQDIW